MNRRSNSRKGMLHNKGTSRNSASVLFDNLHRSDLQTRSIRQNVFSKRSSFLSTEQLSTAAKTAPTTLLSHGRKCRANLTFTKECALHFQDYLSSNQSCINIRERTCRDDDDEKFRRPIIYIELLDMRNTMATPMATTMNVDRGKLQLQ